MEKSSEAEACHAHRMRTLLITAVIALEMAGVKESKLVKDMSAVLATIEREEQE